MGGGIILSHKKWGVVWSVGQSHLIPPSRELVIPSGAMPVPSRSELPASSQWVFLCTLLPVHLVNLAPVLPITSIAGLQENTYFYMLGKRHSPTPTPHSHETESRARVLSPVTAQVPDCLTLSRFPCACASPSVSSGLACASPVCLLRPRLSLFCRLWSLGWSLPTCAAVAQRRASESSTRPLFLLQAPFRPLLLTAPEKLCFISARLSLHVGLSDAASR